MSAIKDNHVTLSGVAAKSLWVYQKYFLRLITLEPSQRFLAAARLGMTFWILSLQLFLPHPRHFLPIHNLIRLQKLC